MGDDVLSAARRERARREGELTRIHAVLACLLLLVLLQFLLFMVGMDGWLGGRMSRVGPTAAASAVCFAGACLLVKALMGKPTA
ncbi:MAG TPA: DUF6755 family protein [Planctomycetota bacterium]